MSVMKGNNRAAALDGVVLTRGEIDVIFSSALTAATKAHRHTPRAFGVSPSHRNGVSLSPDQFLLALELVAQKRFARLIQDQRVQKAAVLGMLAARFLAPFARRQLPSE